jgi:hypothetical protein
VFRFPRLPMSSSHAAVGRADIGFGRGDHLGITRTVTTWKAISNGDEAPGRNSDSPGRRDHDQ